MSSQSNGSAQRSDQNPASGNSASAKQGEGSFKRHTPLAGRKAVIFILVGLILAVVIAVLGIVPRLRAGKRLQQQTDANAAPDVLVAAPTRGKPDDTLLLPGALQAYVDSPIYARTSGYLAHWYADIGAHVRKGTLLAVIESPEINKQLTQAQADLATAEANARNATVQAKRYQNLLSQDAVSQQDTDTYTTSQIATNTQVQSARANVQRLEDLVSFERVYAPFDGIITARNVDNGQLINAGAAANSQMFEEGQIQTLRVYVSIPEVDALGARRGTAAQIAVAEYPGRSFTGHIVRTANSIDPNTRTLLVEINVDNRKGELLPGSYGQVTLHLNTGVPSLVIPVSAMLFRAQGLQVATVVNGHARLLPVTVGVDDGRVIQVVTGLAEDAQVIQNPPDSILEGEAVHVIQPKQTYQKGTPAASQGSKGGDSQQQTGSQQSGQQANTAQEKQGGGGGK